MTNDQYILNQDILSIFTDGKGNRKVYGKKNERVIEISESDNVMIVQGANGQRFTVQKVQVRKV